MRNDRKRAPPRNLVGSGYSSIYFSCCRDAGRRGQRSPLGRPLAWILYVHCALPTLVERLETASLLTADHNYKFQGWSLVAAPAANLQRNFSFWLKSLACTRAPFSLL